MHEPKSILITGATSGIGAELAKQYSHTGVSLYLCGRRKNLLDDVAATCTKNGASVSTYVCDVTDREKLRDWIIACDKKHPIDLIIANAGLGGADSLAGQFGESDKAVRDLFDVNVNGVLNTIEPIKPLMIKRGAGQIAVISSLSSYFGMPDSPAYCASKAATRIYVEALRPVLKPHGVSLNVVCPGFVKTAMSDQLPFSLPFLVSVEKAGRIIRHRLAKNHARISFPFVLAFGSWFGMILPASLSGFIMGHFRKHKGLDD